MDITQNSQYIGAAIGAVAGYIWKRKPIWLLYGALIGWTIGWIFTVAQIYNQASSDADTDSVGQ